MKDHDEDDEMENEPEQEIDYEAEAQRVMKEQMEQMKLDMQNRMKGELSADFQPVEGISLEQWASAQAKLASGGNVKDIIKSMGIDQPKWDRVSAEWNARMSRDSTATIATVYGQAFMNSAQGQYGSTGQQVAAGMEVGGTVSGNEPISLEKFAEIGEAQNAAVYQGIDASSVLAKYGMTAADWGTVGGWWMQKMMTDMKIAQEYERLCNLYKEKFASGSANADIEF